MRERYLACPHCKNKSINRLLLLVSVFVFFIKLKCRVCRGAFWPGKAWQENIIGSLMVAFIIAAGLSIKERSPVPYLILPATMTFDFFIAYFYMKPVAALPQGTLSKILDWLVMLLVLGFLFVLPHFV